MIHYDVPMEGGFLITFPSHTQAVERIVKLITEASRKRVEPQNRDRFIRATLESMEQSSQFGLPGKRYPSLIIYDLPNDTTNEDVQNALKAYSNWGEDLRLRFKMRGRKEGTSHWVLEALFEAFFKLRQLRKIPIKWTMY
ncbi:hypothetical protein AVEN_140049-1 [Araneus ventricosus]|uniref:Uncharacterized protein n=1 Tax=Araneus ventricosus TaxID=182803 RepID=A0A4Y2LGJ4_ARAVE|nr:hypothetical protein AVEN_140049-1 [Araneus ventricosus]